VLHHDGGQGNVAGLAALHEHVAEAQAAVQVSDTERSDLVSKRRGSRRISERAGSHEAMRRDGRRRDTILEAC
jgi:hypothetical protein